MITYFLRLIVCLGIVVLPRVAWGNDRHPAKPDNLSFPDGSCTDRCHVNYLTYYSLYEGEIFRHKSHSLSQGLECNRCHNNDAAHTKTHGGLLIQKKDCWACHHKRGYETTTGSFSKNQELSFYHGDCIRCHTQVKDYLKGEIQGMGIKIPDWMSAAVSCADCHKLESDGLSFKAVRNHCIACHNSDYGLLHDAWRETLDRQIKQFCENGAGTQGARDILRLVQSYGMHNFRLSQFLLKSIGNASEGEHTRNALFKP
ncbi:MAG: hypothetical protein DCC43_13870 [Candidatus Brocadia sp.]|uniref:Heme protein n=1 Tax=Candidatus Brocadia fulgida TaxID=380242 RepID=A0A0M2UZX2_9BACT|nr:MAG: putative heme protein [Candidatus Brocadia fulgida]MBV6467685.1 hypothetical protein [Anaerolineales bacterium]MCC6324031.1 hypothetical protein [Candidatus Brocadia sp.]MCE7911916.1 hypothetical protein [Candidatus Brocadia sp. AMX3]MDG5996939.1 hypothetical protein [Candidatus Brocadia sp.]